MQALIGENEEQKTYMGVNEDRQEENDQAFQTQRVIYDYKSSTLFNTLIFSYLRVDKAFKTVLEWLTYNDIKPDIHPEKWELVYTKMKELEGNEDQDKKKTLSFKVRIQLLKVPNSSGQIVVQFMRLGGSAV